jgi:cation:H+ antiporter
VSIALGFVAGLVGVVVGAELLVRGASRAAAVLGIPPLVVGLTVVAYGTSAPELAVSVRAAAAGLPDLAVANVVGSNVFNVLAIVGVCAIIAPVAARARVVRREIPLMVAVTLAAVALVVDGGVSRLEGAALLAGLAVLTVVTVRAEGGGAPAREERSGPTSLPRDGLLVVAGLALLVLGAGWLVDAASAAAAALGVSELVVGLTVVAAGTSLPELATSLVALVRGERDLAIGNVVGSNLFNVLGILGLSAVLAPAGLGVAPQVVALDVWVMLGASVVLLPMAATGAAVVRWEGLLLLAGYAAYTTVLVRVATGAMIVPSSGAVALAVGLPLVAVAAGAALRRRSRRA